ncbi:hypothetical protein [Fictibacillus phosphorivorans]|uniref:hypothetical protein n=1 Tax=Fictibacillus phosphorivorans TaxID=1221500 RepID=UPI00203B3F83|nr:hypothetical protein [Fictibacillus phosphorivorans]MCM3717020.1 hypothetical protein [Fictibacillus phosphorivorans]MCM3774431.1 hypothetical protein [Fictibacillus phosphorivorans]
MARRYFRKARFPGWLLTVKNAIGQFTLPLIVFQLIRTLLFPSAVDFFIILILLVLHFGIGHEYF